MGAEVRDNGVGGCGSLYRVTQATAGHSEQGASGGSGWGGP